ncbi:MAG: (Fe-S)-binding protein [Planctomycetaceae bacterium]|jgi:L-lactate dehydrogenase complex protein LldE|nr:(Fe-S)-binding protein [Planctomycetaceae bacterium]
MSLSEALQKAFRKWDYPAYTSGEEVALFIPCYVDQFYPSIGRATVQLLEERNIPLVFPKEQTCCGQPAFNSGYWEDARKVMEQFGRAFHGYRWIVTPSGSCAAMCRVFFEEAAPGSEAAELGKRVFDVSEFLVNILGVTSTGAVFPKKVTMHIGCHSRRELGMVDAPMRLLQSIRGLEYVELSNMEECCGFGGTFSVKMAGTSLAMGRKKVESMQKSGADVIVTTDISCAMHFDGIMRHDPAFRSLPVMHLTELLVQR